MYRHYYSREEEDAYKEGLRDEEHNRRNYEHDKYSDDPVDQAYWNGRRDQQREEERKQEEERELHEQEEREERHREEQHMREQMEDEARYEEMMAQQDELNSSEPLQEPPITEENNDSLDKIE